MRAALLAVMYGLINAIAAAALPAATALTGSCGATSNRSVSRNVPSSNAASESRANSDGHDGKTFGHDGADDLPRRGAQRQPDTDLASAQPDLPRDQRAETEHRQRGCRPGESIERQRDEPRVGDLRLDRITQHHHIVNRQRRIECADLRANRAGDRVGTAAGVRTTN